MNRLHIREATPGDAPLILRFIRELAEYERALSEVGATEEMLVQSLFGPEANARSLICEQGEEAIGFALYFYNYSTWQGKYGIYLEDLYISPEYRGIGAGKALLQHIARIAVAEDCGRFEWSVLDWNEPSIAFYESFGAKAKSEWVGYRLSGEALKNFAGG